MDVASTWGFESALAAVRVGQPVFRGLHGRASGLATELHETFSVTFDPFAGLDALASKQYPYAQGVFPVVGSQSVAPYPSAASGPRILASVDGVLPKKPEHAGSEKHSGTLTTDNREVTGKGIEIGTIPSNLADRGTLSTGAQPDTATGAAIPFAAGGPPRAGHRPSQSLLSDALRGSVATQALLPAAQAVQHVDSSATRRTVSAGAIIGGQGVVAVLRDAARVDARGGKSSAHEVPSEAAHAGRPEVLVGQQQHAGRGGLSTTAAGAGAAPVTPRDDVSISGNSSVGGGGPGYFRVTVYLPSREALTLRVPDTASVLDVIGEVLRQLREGRAVRTEPASKSSRRGSGSVQQHRSHASRSNSAATASDPALQQPPLAPLEGDARCYEMRLHDEGGLPDEDFPPLERSRRLKAFGQQGGHEYCLRPLPGMLAAFRASAPTASGASTVGGSTASAQASRQTSIISDSVSVTSSEGRGTHVSGTGGREDGGRRAAALAPPFPASSKSSSSSSSSASSPAPPASGPSPASSRAPGGMHRSEGGAGSGGLQAPPDAGAGVGAGAGAASGHGGQQAPAVPAALASAPAESHDEVLTVLIANHTDEAALPSSLFLPLAGASTVADVVAQVSTVVDLPPGIGLWVCLLPEDQARLCLSRPELPSGTQLSLCGVDTIIVHAAYMQAAAPPPAAQIPSASQAHDLVGATNNHVGAGAEAEFGYGAAAPAPQAAAAVEEEEEVAPALPARTGRHHSGSTVHALSLSQPHPSSGIAAEGLQRLSDRMPPPPPTRYVRSATSSPLHPSELAAAEGRPSSGLASPQPGSAGGSPGGSAASSASAGHRRDGAAGEASAATLSSPVGAASGFGGPASASGYAMTADSPAAGSGGGGGADAARDWQEWPVVKINTRGRRQNRLFGIDRDRITNRKVEKRRLLSDRTVHAERRVADIVRVEVPTASAGNAFAITYRSCPDSDEEGDAGGKSGSGSEATLRYETRTATERVELLHKLRAALAAQRKEGVMVQVP